MNFRVDILKAQPKHLPLLPAIEQAAGMMFRDTAYGDLAKESGFPMEHRVAMRLDLS